ncbi:MAG: HD domain-containing protein [Solobacterium sp.]|nr:HD domain-containing protein [Solobacterium sp.]
MDKERLEKQIAFILEADQEKNITRQTHLTRHGRNENDAEHAWHMAVMAWLLKEYSNSEIDIARTMMMCLIHDIVEIDAGDTYAYDEEGLKTQKAREEAAKERIFALLPDDQRDELTALFDEFEAFETPESCFAHAMDNFQPFLLNDSNGGGDWREHQVSISKVLGRQTKSAKGSRELADYVLEKLEDHVKRGNIIEDREKSE